MVRILINALLIAAILAALLIGTGASVQSELSFPGPASVVTGDPHPAPPHPDLEAKIKKGEIKLPEYIGNHKALEKRGVDVPEKIMNLRKLKRSSRTLPSPASLVSGSGAASQSGSQSQQAAGFTGQFKTLVLLVDFNDRPKSVNAQFYDTLVFSTNGSNSMWKFYWENSYGQFDIMTVNPPSSLGWSRNPRSYYNFVHGQWDGTKYVNCTYGYGGYPNNSQKLTEELVDMLDPYVDFSQYDNDGNGYVDGILLVHSGSGAELSGKTCDIWSHKWGITPRSRDGVYISAYSIQPEYWTSPGDMTIGVYSHEFGHILGLPDLYDLDSSSRGIGKWSLMSGGSWNGALGNSPSHMDAWSKQRLGWVTLNALSSGSQTIQLPQSETVSTGIYKLYGNATNTTEYFLLENRQKVGYDSALPGAGMLVWHIDDKQTSNSKEWYPGHTSTGHLWVALEQADGLWELEKNIDYGDTGDPYPGSTSKRVFDAFSTPNSDNYAGQRTGISLSNISNSSSTMGVSITFGGSGVAPVNGTLFVSSSPAAANVYLGGTYRGVTPLTLLDIVPGNYPLSVWKLNYFSDNQTVSIVAGQTTNANSNLVGLPSNISVNTTPSGAFVYLGGVFKGISPLLMANVNPAPVAINLFRINYTNTSASFLLPPNTTYLLDVVLKPINGTLNVNSSPANASIFLNGSFKGYTNTVIANVLPGSYPLVIGKLNYSNYTQALVFSSNQTITLNVSLIPLPGKIIVNSNPPAANVFLDSMPKGTAPLTISDVSIGSHQLAVTKANYSNYSQVLTISPNETKTFNVTLSPLPGTILAASNPSGGSVYLDGLLKGVTPVTIANVAIGSHQIVITKANYSNFSQTLAITANMTVSVNATLQPLLGTIQASSSPTGASTYLDGILKGLTPLTINNVGMGLHLIELTKIGYFEYNVTVNTTPNSTIVVSAILTLIPTATPLPSPSPSPSISPSPSPSPSPTPIPDSCNDSDGGIKYAIRGSVSGYAGGILYDVDDVCNGSLLTEYFCSSTKANSTMVNCASGCSNGACSPAPSPSPSVSPSPSPTASPTASPSPQTGSIFGTTNPSAATMSVDFSARGLTPLTVSGLTVGPHWVEFTKSGYQSHLAFVDVFAGQTTLVNVTLVSVPSPSPSPSASPSIAASSTPGPSPSPSPSPSISPSPTPQPQNSCIDSDNGIVPEMAGTVSGVKNYNPYFKSDSCMKGNKLKEYYCGGTSAFFTRVGCTACAAGTCIASPTPAPNATASPTPTAVPSPIPPIIAFDNSSTETSNDSAIIIWQTDIPSDSAVFYGMGQNYGSLYFDPETDVIHEAYLENLQPGVVYYYFVRSCNGLNCSNTTGYEFETLSNPAIPTPTPQIPTPPPTGGGGGTYVGGSSGWSPPAPTMLPSPSPSPSRRPAITPEFTEISQEIEERLPEIKYKPEEAEVRQMVDEATALEQQGRKQEALSLLFNARQKLLNTIATSRTQKANSSWQLALVILTLFLSALWFRFDRMRKEEEEGKGSRK